MDRRLQGLLIANGALVLLAGFLAGFPYATAIPAAADPNAGPAAAEALRAWHMAHLEGVLNGMLMIASAAAAAHLALSKTAEKVVFWGLVVAGWTNIVASSISAMTGGRGTGATGLDWNTLDFTLFMFGIVGAVAAMIALVLAGLKARR
ncbi:MAG: hypothetical protein P4L72_06770 [Parvibaculum sp.]|jgi:hypothetical protein|uniref:hypothetical protein n=1 Tax=Parvibaculum sp. TaxID=2024848 RepID=UPI00284475C5|nr:hypothetical protein [Parvibaculum sp.]MDR3498914.1 hypothetical protein [Parvibaculum sp.]